MSLTIAMTFTAETVYAENIQDLMTMTLGDLQNVEVTSVSRRAENQFKAAAAVSVLTQEDIKRSGATTIPDALRMVPGVNVARIDSSKWAITARGFNRQFSNKLLVLIDGRSVYNPLFSGVYWDAQNMLLEDVERIEVIRGSGATLWGANAVNGIINIITKNTEDTKGTYLSARYGNQERGTFEGRYGGTINENTNYRVYGKFLGNDESRNSVTKSGNDDKWYQRRVGFRVDSLRSYNSIFRLQGDIYDGESSQRGLFPGYVTPAVLTELTNDETYKGGNLLGSWKYSPSLSSEHYLQTYIEYHQRQDERSLEWQRITFDIDYQHRFSLNERNEFIWGLNYRFLADDLDDYRAPNGQEYLSYEPNSQKNNLYSAFAQNDYAIIPDELFFTLGTKFEYNYYTDLEVQPNARVAWYPSRNSTVWGAVSRAVRTPTRGEVSLSSIAASTPGGFIRLSADANEDFESENLTSYELGYRFRPKSWTSFDISSFYNIYDDLRAFEPGISGISNVNTASEFVARNLGKAKTFGIEIENKTDISDSWSLTTGYSFIEIDAEVETGSLASLSSEELDTPENQLYLLSRYDLTPEIQLDSNLYITDSLADDGIPSEMRWDARVNWKVSDQTNLTLVGQNLTNDYSAEFKPFLFSPSAEIGRSVYLQLSTKF